MQMPHTSQDSPSAMIFALYSFPKQSYSSVYVTEFSQKTRCMDGDFVFHGPFLPTPPQQG